MIDALLRLLMSVTFGLAFVLLARRPARKMFGAAPAFTLWLLPGLMALAPLLPHAFVASKAWTLSVIAVSAHALPANVSAGSSFPFAWLLIATWAAGALIAFCRLALQYFRVVRAISPLPQSWREMIASAAPELAASRVWVHEAGPAVLWAWRTRVLLPPDFDVRFDNDARRLVLHHELTHIRRGDALWLLIAELACATLWFHPLVWLSLPRFRLDQELACDERTLRSLAGRASHYARALLESVAVQPLSALIPWLAEPQLKERIAMISIKHPGALRRRTGFLAVTGLLCAGLWATTGETPALAGQPHAATSPSVDVTFKNRNPPHYPTDAIQNGQQGTVVLEVAIDANGNVQGIKIDPEHSVANPELRQVSIAAAAKWKFKPGMRDGKPVGGIVQIPVNFAIPGVTGACPAGQQHALKEPYECAPATPAQS